MVRCILVETTKPERMRPRMETRPVKGHFLSGIKEKMSVHRVSCIVTLALRRSLHPRPAQSTFSRDQRTDVVPINGILRCPEAQPDVLVPTRASLALLVRLAALRLVVEEDVRLLLEGALALDG